VQPGCLCVMYGDWFAWRRGVRRLSHNVGASSSTFCEILELVQIGSTCSGLVDIPDSSRGTPVPLLLTRRPAW
jgi:hypothetical protein